MAVKRSSSSAEERCSSEQEQGDPSPAAESEEDQLFCSCETAQENHHWNDIPASTAPAAELAELFCSCKAVREQGDGGRSQLVVGLLGWRLPEPRKSKAIQTPHNWSPDTCGR